jgi:hypothetical protein
MLLLVMRINESRNTSPQAQKILNEIRLREINSYAFVLSKITNLNKFLLISDLVVY